MLDGQEEAFAEHATLTAQIHDEVARQASNPDPGAASKGGAADAAEQYGLAVIRRILILRLEVSNKLIST